MKAKARKSKLFLVLSIILIFPALLIASTLVFDSKTEIEQVKATSLEATASVIFKNIETRSCGKSNCKDYIFSILYFDKPEDEMQIVELAPGVIAKLPKIQVGDSHSSNLKVSNSIYNKYEAGDRIKILYLADDFDKVWLADNVNNWNIWTAGLWSTFALLLLAFALLVLSFRFRRIEEKNWLELGLD